MEQNIVGYQLNHPYPEGPKGASGIGYNYIFASNGVFIQANNELLGAIAPVAYCNIRGLAPETAAGVTLTHKKIPAALFDLALDVAILKKVKEVYLAITWSDGEYHLLLVPQEGTAGSVRYSVVKNTVLQIHSHPDGLIPAFSTKDDDDEQGLGLSLLIANPGGQPSVAIRVGVYGSYYPILWSEVFDGELKGAVDAMKPQKTKEREHVLQSGNIVSEADPGGSWWHRFFGSGRSP